MPRLQDIVITEVSLVTKPANKRRFLLFKADQGDDMKTVENESLLKAINGLGDKLAKLTDAKTEPVKEGAPVDEITKSVETLAEKVDKLLESDQIGKLEKQRDDALDKITELEKKLQDQETEFTETVTELTKQIDEVAESIPDEDKTRETVEAILEEVTKEAA